MRTNIKKKTKHMVKMGKQGLFKLLFSRTGIVSILLLLQIAWIISFLRHYFFVYWSVSTTAIMVVLIYLLNTRGNPSIKLTWAALIAVAPTLGILLYLFVRIDPGHRLEWRIIQQSEDESMVYASEQPEVMEQLQREEPGLYRLASYTQKFGGFSPYQNTSVRYFPNGETAFDEMLLQLERAEQFVFLEYFIVKEGYMWGHILDVLRRKAQQGVEVRVMYDDTSSVNLPHGYSKELERLGIRCKTFSPLHPLVSTYYNNRDHRKILVIDGQTAFTGGINLADEYINEVERFGHWKDNALTPELVQALYRAVDARDLPGMADVDSSLLLFCEEIKKIATVALSGECADEIFGGYPWYRDPTVREQEGFPWAQSTAWRAEFVQPGLLRDIDPVAYVDHYYRKTVEESSVLEGTSKLETRMKQMMNLNVDWFMQTLLDRKDRMSMYSSLEVRVPFCDHRIAEYLYTVPWEFKDHSGYEKGLLREAMRGILPDEVLWRKKSPYPKTHNPAYLKTVSEESKKILHDPSAPLHQIVRPQALEELLMSDRSTPWYGQLMTTPQTIAYFLQLNYWLEKYRVKIIS